MEKFNREAVQRRLEQQAEEAKEARQSLLRENTRLTAQLGVSRRRGLSVGQRLKEGCLARVLQLCCVFVECPLGGAWSTRGMQNP